MSREEFDRFLKGAIGLGAAIGAFLKQEHNKAPLDSTGVVEFIPKPDVDFDSLNLPYKNSDILEVKKVTSGAIPSPLEHIVDLMEGRDHLLYVRLKDGKELLVKPYKSTSEREILARLRGSKISLVLGHTPEDTKPGYFFEELPGIPSIEDALKSRSTFLPKVADLFGMALYTIHSKGVSYNGRFDRHVFADDISKKVRISNFSNAVFASSQSYLRSDIIQAFKYMETLATEYHVGEKDFLRAIGGFSLGYMVPIDGENKFSTKGVYDDAVRYVLLNESPNAPIATALKRITKN